jgi:hypothetical protein
MVREVIDWSVNFVAGYVPNALLDIPAKLKETKSPRALLNIRPGAESRLNA